MGSVVTLMIVAWLIMRPGRALYNAIKGNDPEQSRTAIDRAIDYIVEEAGGSFVGNAHIGGRTLGAIKRLFGGGKNTAPSDSGGTPASTAPGGATPPAGGTPGPSPAPTSVGGGGGGGGGGDTTTGGGGSGDTEGDTPGGARPEEIDPTGGGDTPDPTGPTPGGGQVPPGDPTGDPAGGGATTVDWGAWAALLDDDDPPRVVQATAERLWPEPTPPAGLPPAPPKALEGSSTEGSTTMTAIATTGATTGAITVATDSASPEITKKIGSQFDVVLGRAIGLLDQYEGALRSRSETIGGETMAQIAQMKQGLAIAKAAATKLAHRGAVQARAAEPVRNVDDVQLPANSYYAGNAR
jgi:hypothetical protein